MSGIYSSSMEVAKIAIEMAISTREQEEKLKEKYKKCIARFMFYAFLSKSNIASLKDIVKSIENKSIYQEDNKRIFDNLELDINFLKSHIAKCRKTFSFSIDSLLEQANLLSKDESLTKEERVNNALARFKRISESEIVTPSHICNQMYDVIGKNKLINIVSNDGKILDIASKTGEFTVALYKILKDNVDYEKLKNSIFCIPTSKVTYEFTRKIYEILDFPLENIAVPPFTSYSLLEYKKKDKNGNETKELDYSKIIKLIKKQFKKKGESKVKIEAIVGNPPYQEDTSGDSTGTNPIYHHFIDISQKLSPINVMITPARFLFNAGKTPKAWNKKMLSDKHFKVAYYTQDPDKVFEGIPITGGVVILPKFVSEQREENVLNKVTYRNYNVASRPKLTAKQVAHIYCNGELGVVNNLSSVNIDKSDIGIIQDDIFDIKEMLLGDNCISESIKENIAEENIAKEIIGCRSNSTLAKINNQPIALNFVDYGIKDDNVYFEICYEEKTKTVIKVSVYISGDAINEIKEAEINVENVKILMSNYFKEQLQLENDEYDVFVEYSTMQEKYIIIKCNLVQYGGKAID